MCAQTIAPSPTSTQPTRLATPPPPRRTHLCTVGRCVHASFNNSAQFNCFFNICLHSSRMGGLPALATASTCPRALTIPELEGGGGGELAHPRLANRDSWGETGPYYEGTELLSLSSSTSSSSSSSNWNANFSSHQARRASPWGAPSSWAECIYIMCENANFARSK